MKDSLHVLAISGVLAVAGALSSAIAGDNAIALAQSAPSAAQLAGPTPAASSAPIPGADLKKARSEIRSAWRDYEKCDRSKVCSEYFESFGVGLSFNDGTIVSFAHVQRLTASKHDCIVNAHDALDRGDRAMAVQWVMASQMLEPLDRNWVGDHPDAVIEALRRCCS
jgi:hypothetical protein